MGILHCVVNVRFFISGLRPGTGCLLGWSSAFLLLWTLAPRDYVTYYQAQVLSGHTWSAAKKFSILNLSSLHPYGKPYLGYTARRQFTLLGDGSCCSATFRTARRWFTLLGNCSELLGSSSRWSDHEFDCSALFAPARTSSRRRCTMGTRRSGTGCRGYDPGYPRQIIFGISK